jgi:hypothetical protein
MRSSHHFLGKHSESFLCTYLVTRGLLSHSPHSLRACCTSLIVWGLPFPPAFLLTSISLGRLRGLPLHYPHGLSAFLGLPSQSEGFPHNLHTICRLPSHFLHGMRVSLTLLSLCTSLSLSDNWPCRLRASLTIPSHSIRASSTVPWHLGGIPHCLKGPLALCPHNSLALLGLSLYRFLNTFLTLWVLPSLSSTFPCQSENLPSLRTSLTISLHSGGFGHNSLTSGHIPCCMGGTLTMCSHSHLCSEGFPHNTQACCDPAVITLWSLCDHAVVITWWCCDHYVIRDCDLRQWSQCDQRLWSGYEQKLWSDCNQAVIRPWSETVIRNCGRLWSETVEGCD